MYCTMNYVHCILFFSIDPEVTGVIEESGTEKGGKIEMREIEERSEDRMIETV